MECLPEREVLLDEVVGVSVLGKVGPVLHHHLRHGRLILITRRHPEKKHKRMSDGALRELKRGLGEVQRVLGTEELREFKRDFGEV